MEALQKAVTEDHCNSAPSLSREHHQVSVMSFLAMITSFFRAVGPFCTCAFFCFCGFLYFVLIASTFGSLLLSV